MIFDSHVHYDDDAFNEDREAVVTSLPSCGLRAAVNIGSNIKSSNASVLLAQKYEYIYAAVGVHPNETLELELRGLEEIRELASRPKVVAIGEIGLDYHWDEPERDIQKKWFRRQLQLARELDLPVVVHSRDAAKDTYDIMREEGGSKIKAVIHCFAYEKEMAKVFLDLGYYIGIGGVLTYKNARKQQEVLGMMPLDRLLLETDCPYLTPVPHRGERNFSGYLPLVLAKMGEIKEMEPEKIEEITYRNACRFYGIENGTDKPAENN